MDFSQPNKINSNNPRQNQNQNDYYQNNPMNMYSQNKFMPKSFQHAKCVHQSNNSVPQHHHQSMMQTPHDSSNRNFMHKMTKNFEPYSFNPSSPESFCLPTSSYFNSENYGGHEMIEQQQQQQQLQAYNEDMNEINVEYFQCAPPVPIRNEINFHPTNPFRPVTESMPKYSNNSVEKHRRDKIGDTANSQTFFYSYNSSKESEEPLQSLKQDEKLFKSFTKIISIPNGIKIITEIKKDDNINDQRDENGNKGSNSGNDKWLNKQIEVTLDNTNEVECDDGNDNDSGEFCADDEKN